MTDKQQGWNDALEIVLDTFRDFAWQKEQGDERERAALDMEKQVKHKCREKPGEPRRNKAASCYWATRFLRRDRRGPERGGPERDFGPSR